MKRRTTLQDIALDLKLTPATVSRALNNHPEISDKTKSIVNETATRLNYNRNKIASSLRSGKTNVIGVLIPSAEQSFFGAVIHGITNLANENGYDIIIYQSNEKQEYEKKGIKAFMGARVDGILASLSKGTVDCSHILSARQQGIPIVLFDRVQTELDIPSVVVDDRKGAFLATEHLISQGYKRIAHISGPQQIKAFSERLEGYKQALQAHHIPFDPLLVNEAEVFTIDGSACKDYYIEQVKNCINHFLSLPTAPDAIFAVDDLVALGAMRELKNRGFLVPEDFGIIGFCNEIAGKHTTPSLSTIDQQTVLMGQEAFKMIYQLINDKDKGSLSVQKIVLEPVPIYRESSVRRKL